MKKNNRDLLFFTLSLALWWGLWYKGLVPKAYVVSLSVLLIACFSAEWIRESPLYLRFPVLAAIALFYPYCGLLFRNLAAPGPLEGLLTLLFCLHFALQWRAFRSSFEALFAAKGMRLFAAVLLSVAFGLVWTLTDLAPPDLALLRALPARLGAAYPRALLAGGIHMVCFLLLPDLAVKKHFGP